jgi:tripartite ATP-independent transporter DctP family solute receptor
MTKKNLVLILSLVVVFLFSVGLSFAAGEKEAAETYVIKLSHGCPEGDPTHLAAVKFKELAEEYTDGGVEVQIFPNNQLGSEQEVAQDLRMGTLEAEILYTGNLQPLAPSVGVLMLPYMFTTNEEVWHAMDAIHDELNKRVIDEADVRILGYLEKGFRVLTNSKKPVETLEDLKGLKIRVSKVAIAIETFKSWGLEPIPMAWDEVFSALQQGVIHGQENPYTAVLSVKFYEIQKYITEIHYMIWSGPLIISEKYFQSLPKDIQDALVRAGKDTADYERKLSQEMTVKAKKELEDKGMILLGPPKDEEEWQRRAQSIWPQFYDKVGGKEWVDQALALIQG